MSLSVLVRHNILSLGTALNAMRDAAKIANIINDAKCAANGTECAANGSFIVREWKLMNSNIC